MKSPRKRHSAKGDTLVSAPAPEHQGKVAFLWGAGSKVLVVEDDYILAQTLCERLEGQGAQVIGPAATVAEAVALLDAGLKPDSAILDTHLDDEESYPLADILMGRHVPVVLATDAEAWTLPADYAELPRAGKPVDPRRLPHALELLRPTNT
jgi:DNA-binding response OmpR family regulator